MPSLRGAAALALTALCVCAPTAVAHKGNPNYSSEVRSIQPSVAGLEAQVLGNDDRIELRNASDSVVVIEGYRNEPYLRFLRDGTVQVNRRSPAGYLNQDRFAAVDVPASARPDAPPRWERVAQNGRYDWHDHRIHWMSKTPPEPVRRDESRRTKIFDWKLPIAVQGRPGTIQGTLTWLGKDSGGFPTAALIALAVVALAGPLLLRLAQRRRRTSAGGEEDAW
ncbi:MAG: hypothetical protein QOI32_2044 [Thermoleophilaceae bacterium]|nr:hypothetical protein [Thermoleophilaceae bacterium]